MNLKVLTFGIAREITGSATTVVVTGSSVTVNELLGLLSERYPELRKLSSLTMAVNGVYAAGDTVVTNNDEIALIPPVSGG